MNAPKEILYKGARYVLAATKLSPANHTKAFNIIKKVDPSVEVDSRPNSGVFYLNEKIDDKGIAAIKQKLNAIDLDCEKKLLQGKTLTLVVFKAKN